jgi:predicted nucleic acid-binding protein
MLKVFVDTDVCIDLLSDRKPFNEAASKLFSLADLRKLKIYVASLSFANIDYVLRSQYAGKNLKQIISKFKTLVTVLPVGDKTIDLAMASDFKDFEDAIQYYVAIENYISIFITRNIKDYKKTNITVMTPEAFLSGKI